MSKLKIVVSAVWYPMCIARYFLAALKYRNDVEIKMVGPFTDVNIPWAGGMKLPKRYVIQPDVALPSTLIGKIDLHPAPIERSLNWDKCDLWLNIDSTFCVKRPSIADKVATIAVDPHVLDYSLQRKQCDYFFNMQKVYSEEGDIYLPYAYSKSYHYPLEIEKVYDVCLIGLQYDTRSSVMFDLRDKNLRVYYGIGDVYYEYNKRYNESHVAFSWSSKQDLIARVFEAMAMRVPLVCNEVPDMNLFFENETHYLGFTEKRQALRNVVESLVDYDTAIKRAENAYSIVVDTHSYDNRIQTILEMVGLV